MDKPVKDELEPKEYSDELWHSAYPVDLPDLEVTTRFASDIGKILPAAEIHVVEPYLLYGAPYPEIHAATVALLLAPALRVARRVAFVHGETTPKARALNVQGLLADIMIPKYPNAEVVFINGGKMHGRYVVADRSKALLMDFSFNTLQKHHGTALVVSGPDELDGILAEVERFDASV